MIKLSGPVGVTGSVPGRALKVTTEAELPSAIRRRHALLIRADALSKPEPAGFGALLVEENVKQPLREFESTVVLGDWSHHLQDGDVVRVSRDLHGHGHLKILWRRHSRSMALMVTERCSSNCVMCSQPPKASDDSYLVDEILDAIPLIDRNARELGLSGGEPLLLFDRFLHILLALHANLPDTAIHVLTNGRLLAYLRYAQAIAAVGNRDIMFGIPLYSCIPSEHDAVVQARGAFDQTIQGILNLLRVGVPVEIRIVLHRMTSWNLQEFSRFVYRNLPGVSHVAFMGLEDIGFVRMNRDALWVDPADYQDGLCSAVDFLDRRGIRTSIYNLPLCVVPAPYWRFARQSISDWKNDFVEQCESCAARTSCAGFFSWNRAQLSRAVRPMSQSEFAAAREVADR